MLVVVAQSGSRYCWLCKPSRVLEPGNWPATTGWRESRLSPIDPRCSALSNTFRLFFLSFFVCLLPFFLPSPVFFCLFLAEWSSVLLDGTECSHFLDPRIRPSKMKCCLRTSGRGLSVFVSNISTTLDTKYLTVQHLSILLLLK